MHGAHHVAQKSIRTGPASNKVYSSVSSPFSSVNDIFGMVDDEDSATSKEAAQNRKSVNFFIYESLDTLSKRIEYKDYLQNGL